MTNVKNGRNPFLYEIHKNSYQIAPKRFKISYARYKWENQPDSIIFVNLSQNKTRNFLERTSNRQHRNSPKVETYQNPKFGRDPACPAIFPAFFFFIFFSFLSLSLSLFLSHFLANETQQTPRNSHGFIAIKSCPTF